MGCGGQSGGSWGCTSHMPILHKPIPSYLNQNPSSIGKHAPPKMATKIKIRPPASLILFSRRYCVLLNGRKGRPMWAAQQAAARRCRMMLAHDPRPQSARTPRDSDAVACQLGRVGRNGAVVRSIFGPVRAVGGLLPAGSGRLPSAAGPDQRDRMATRLLGGSLADDDACCWRARE